MVECDVTSNPYIRGENLTWELETGTRIKLENNGEIRHRLKNRQEEEHRQEEEQVRVMEEEEEEQTEVVKNDETLNYTQRDKSQKRGGVGGGGGGGDLSVNGLGKEEELLKMPVRKSSSNIANGHRVKVCHLVKMNVT